MMRVGRGHGKVVRKSGSRIGGRKTARGFGAPRDPARSLAAVIAERAERHIHAERIEEKGPHIAHDCGLDETKVRFFGDSIALVYGSEHALGKDKSQPGAKVCQVWTDTWLKRGGKWQVVASQDNRVPCP